MQSVTSLLQRPLSVETIGSVRHFFCSSPFTLSAPPPPAYELIYAASQEVLLTIDGNRRHLKSGDASFLPPSSSCTLRPAGKTPPCLLRISFSCPFPLPDFLLAQGYTFSETENKILAQLLLETPENPLRLLLLEQLLRLLMQRQPDTAPGDRLWQNLLSYLQSHLHTRLTLSRICCDNSISRSRLEKLFYEKSGCGAMAYFSRMKAEAARDLIRLGNMNMTQIAAALGYSSVHYFSRQFKKQTKMTPTEYSRSIGKDSGTSPDL